MSIKKCHKFRWTTYRTILKNKTIFYARKSLLFNGRCVWIKKDGGLFDVTMGAFNGAEVWAAVGNCLFHQLSKSYNKKDIGSYRDRGLAIFKSDSGFKVQKNKKGIQELFKYNHLSITIQFNLKIVNFNFTLMSASIFLMIHTDLFARQTMKSHIYIYIYNIYIYIFIYIYNIYIYNIYIYT